MTAVMEARQQANRYNQQVEQYCRDNGLTITQYEKQVFWADRDFGSYPEPEQINPDRLIQFMPSLDQPFDRDIKER